MDKLQLIASIIDSLAWPIAVMLIVFALRTQLQTLIDNLAHLRYGDLEMSFGQKVRELGDKAKAAGLHILEDAPQTEPAGRDSEQIIADAMRLASEFQGSAVILAWTAVENELRQVATRLAFSPDYPPRNMPAKNIELLYKRGHLDADSRSLLHQMRRLRNAAAHPSRGITEISADDAYEFIALAKAITDRLKNLGQ